GGVAVAGHRVQLVTERGLDQGGLAGAGRPIQQHRHLRGAQVAQHVHVGALREPAWVVQLPVGAAHRTGGRLGPGGRSGPGGRRGGRGGRGGGGGPGGGWGGRGYGRRDRRDRGRSGVGAVFGQAGGGHGELRDGAAGVAQLDEPVTGLPDRAGGTTVQPSGDL